MGADKKSQITRDRMNSRLLLKQGISVSDIKKFEEKQKTKNKVEEEVAANCAGSGAIQGMGTGQHPESEPGVPKKKLKVIMNDAKLLIRKAPK